MFEIADFALSCFTFITFESAVNSRLSRCMFSCSCRYCRLNVRASCCSELDGRGDSLGEARGGGPERVLEAPRLRLALGRRGDVDGLDLVHGCLLPTHGSNGRARATPPACRADRGGPRRAPTGCRPRRPPGGPCYRRCVPKEYLRKLCDQLLHAQKPLRVLRAINWDPHVHERFFKSGARELPRPEYPALGFSRKKRQRELRKIRQQIRGRNPIEELLRNRCDEFMLVADLLAARGTRRFYEISRRLYGDPRDRFPDHNVDNLAIARAWASRPRARDEDLSLDSDQAAARVAEICNPLLGGH